MINPTTHEGGAAVAEPPADAAPQATALRFIISGEKVTAATADLPEDQREAIRWAAAYCREKNLHHAEFAKLLRKPGGEPYSKDSIYHMFTGGRDSSALVSMVEAIHELMEVEESRANMTRPPFVETRLAKRVFEVCRRAFLRQKLCFVFGDSQIGKTWALEEYWRRNKPGVRTIYVRMPTGGALGAFLALLTEACGLSTSGHNNEEMKRKILEFFDCRMLLIVDEAEECLHDRRKSGKGVDTLNFIREIHDRRKCGVIIAGAPDLKRGLFTGRYAESMRRLVRRSIIPLQLPATPSKQDLATFAAHFGLPPIPDEEIEVRFTFINEDCEDERIVLKKNPLELQTDVIRQSGLGRWCVILGEASDMAREKRKPIAWGHVVRAHYEFQKLESMPAEQKEAA